MERIDIWFGDSWTIGSELQSDFTKAEIREFSKSTVPNFRDKSQNPFLSYPYLVSKYRKTVYENYAIAGGSYEFAYFQMCNWYANNKFRQDCEYCFWVQTTASSRGFGIDHNYKRHHFLGIKQYHRGELLDFQRAKGSPEFVDFDTNNTDEFITYLGQETKLLYDYVLFFFLSQLIQYLIFLKLFLENIQKLLFGLIQQLQNYIHLYKNLKLIFPF